MENLIFLLIQYTTFFTCTFYTFAKLQKCKLKLWNIVNIPIFACLAVPVYFTAQFIPMLAPIAFIILSFLFLLIRFRNTLYDTITNTVIATGLSFAFYGVGFIISIPFARLLHLINNKFIKKLFTQIIIAVVQVGATLLLFYIKKKKFQSGINAQKSNSTIELLLMASILSIIVMMLVNTKQMGYSILELTLIVITILSLLLVVWYKRYIEKDYIEKTQEQTVTLYEQQINDLVADNEKKDGQNVNLGDLLHRDVAIMPDLIEAFGDLAEKHNDSEAEIHCQEIKALYAERQEALEEIETEVKFPDFQPRVLKSAAKQIYKFAKVNGVEFSVEKLADTSAWFNLLKVHKFHLILQYLCRNAVYATKNCPNAKVLARFGRTGEALPCIKVFDNGAAFDVDVIEKMGLTHITTHKDDNGNGYGLYTIFENLQEYKASFILDECAENGFCKSIEIIFDGCQKITVRTNRQNVAKICQKRGFEVEFVQDVAA